MNFQNLSGILGQLFQVDQPNNGPAIGVHPNEPTGLSTLSGDGSAFVKMLVGYNTFSGDSRLNQATALLTLLARGTTVHELFDGSSPPAPGSVFGRCFLCNVTGGGFTIGHIYISDTNTLIDVTPFVSVFFSGVNGTLGALQLSTYQIYLNTQPDFAGEPMWERGYQSLDLVAGASRAIVIPFDYTDGTIDSTAEVPDGGIVTDLTVAVFTEFDGLEPYIGCTVGAAELAEFPKIDLRATGLFHTKLFSIISGDNPFTVEIDDVGDCTQGTGAALINYCIAQI